MVKPKISILITSKDNSKKLNNLLASIKAQTLKCIETILIDDGSTPPYQNIEVSKIIRNETSIGCIKSRNKLGKIGLGDYFFFVDDDVVLPDESFLERSIKLLEDHPDCGVLAFGQSIPGIGENCLQPNTSTNLCYCATYFGWTHCFRADVWRSSGGLCELFDYGYEETEHSLRLLDNGIKILYDPKLKVIHDSYSKSKKLDLRRNQNLRNNLLADLLRHHLSTLPRVIWHGFKRIYLENRRSGVGVWKSLGWCFWAGADSFSKIMKILRLRKPVNRNTIKKAYLLTEPPFFHPPQFPV